MNVSTIPGRKSLVNQRYQLKIHLIDMLRSLINGYIFLVCVFEIISRSESAFSNTIQKREYNYAYDVWPVDSCPMNESAWQAAVARTGCKDTRGYHCVPDKFHKSLIEFCYNKTRILVADGNCLELAANGILNHVKCHNFTSGCPDKPYFSDQIYRHPVCLLIMYGCFIEDIQCFRQKLKNSQTQTREMTSISTSTDCEQQTHSNTTPTDCSVLLALLIVVFVLFIFSLIALMVLIIILRKSKKKIIRRANINKEEVKMINADEEQFQFINKDEDQVQIANADEEQIEMNNTSERGPHKIVFPDVLREIESELLVDNTYLSQLIRRLCRHGNLKNFEYLLEKRILKKKKDANVQRILTSRDKDGYTLLHCAAEGGSVDIFKALINATNQIKLDDTTYDGRTVLHIACKNNHVPLCRFLLLTDIYNELLVTKKSNAGWSAAHFTAAVGSIQVLNSLEDKGLDMKDVTKNGLNVLDIACLHNNTNMCKVLMTRDDLRLPLDKSDENGWTIAHFATMVGNNYVFNSLIEKNITMVKTKRQKTILHICCEYGNHDICSTIIEHFKEILYDKDDDDWNALHYASKGGNLKVYKELEHLFKKRARLCEITRDERTVLHIACLNKSTKICQYICNEKTYKSIINSKSEFKDWTAAHYVAVEMKDDGTEEELIPILVKGGIDLQAVTTDGLTVLGVACEHRNRSLINYLLKEHNELIGVGIPYLRNAAKASNDENILSQINEALENFKGRKVDIVADKRDETERQLKWHFITSETKFALNSGNFTDGTIFESSRL